MTIVFDFHYQSFICMSVESLQPSLVLKEYKRVLTDKYKVDSCFVFLLLGLKRC